MKNKFVNFCIVLCCLIFFVYLVYTLDHLNQTLDRITEELADSNSLTRRLVREKFEQKMQESVDKKDRFRARLFSVILVIFGYVLTNYIQPSINGVLDKFKEASVDRIVSAEWRFETISFSWFLSLPWTYFPNKNKLPIPQLGESVYHQILFDIMVLGLKEKILDSDTSKLGYINQFVPEASIQAEKYIGKLFDIPDRYYPERVEFDQLRDYWKNKLKGIICTESLYLLQCSILSQVNGIDSSPNYFDENQLTKIFEILWAKSIEKMEIDENDITDDSLQKLQESLTKVLFIKFDNPLTKTYKKYKEDEDPKKKLLVVLEDTVRDIYLKSRDAAKMKTST